MADAIEAPPVPQGAGRGGACSHVVVVVDHSGSMRKADVPGYDSRTAAVYDCLARDLVEPQLKLGNVGKMEVSLIEMSDDAEVIVERHAAGQGLLTYLKACAHRRARSHGNYLPALDVALELLSGDAAAANQLFLVFLSDGAPSDHVEMACAHGYEVWQPCPSGQLFRNGKPRLQDCPLSKQCRAAVQKRVHQDCVERVKRMGDLLGRDRVYVGTVAFGPPSENYEVLQAMAAALPRSSFQKLGLSASCLRTAFTSLTSSLTSLRTEAAGVGAGLTLRPDIGRQAKRQTYEEREVITGGDGWDVYVSRLCIAKRRYDLEERAYVDVPLTRPSLALELERRYPGRVQLGIAHAEYKFSEGAERVVYQCTEVVSVDGGITAYCVGPRLVAKSTRYEENLTNERFHRTFCRTQGEAEDLAQLFNRRLAGGPEWQIHFLPCYVYTLMDRRYPGGKGEILVEEELDGKFTKWNNNAGGVRGARGIGDSLLGAIVEDDEEEGEEEVSSGAGPVSVQDVPQCFSHFTYDVTNGQKLVCDLQGVWNPVDGFTMTDPVIHHSSGSKRNGATDKGPTGIRDFFATHVCSALCRRLGLRPGMLQ